MRVSDMHGARALGRRQARTRHMRGACAIHVYMCAHSYFVHSATCAVACAACCGRRTGEEEVWYRPYHEFPRLRMGTKID
jgi:hypothetical protein